MLAFALLPILRALMPSDFPRIHEIRLDAMAAAVACASALAASLLVGVLPAVRQPRRHSRDAPPWRIANRLGRTSREPPSGQVARAARAERRFALWLFQAFTAMPMTLAAFRIYGLLAYLVEHRRKEIGIRCSLGATRGNMARWSFGTGSAWRSSAWSSGSPPPRVASRVLSGFLFGVSSTDAPSYAAAPVVLLLVSALASVAPALAAARAEPLTALRQS